MNRLNYEGERAAAPSNLNAVAKRALTDAFEAAMKDLRQPSAGSAHLSETARVDLPITALTSAMEAISQQSQLLSLELRKNRNKSAAFNQLPIEIVQAIFASAVDLRTFGPPSAPSHTSKLRQLASVCTFWLDLVGNSSRLWAVADSTETPSPHAQMQKVAEPASAPHRLYRHDGGLPGSSSFSDRSMVICIRLVPRGDLSPHALDFQHAFSLKTLHLEVDSEPYQPLLGTAVVGIAALARLETLSLNKFQISLLDGLPSNLRELRIPKLPSMNPDVHDILRGIQGTPCLEILVLKDFRTVASTSNPCDVVQLVPRLKWLQISDLLPDHTRILLQAIQAPNLRALKLSIIVESDFQEMDHARAWLEPCLPFIDEQVAKCKATPVIELSHKAFTSFSVRCSENLLENMGPTGFDITFRGLPLSVGIIEWFSICFLRMAASPELALSIADFSGRLTPHILPTIIKFPYITRLRLSHEQRTGGYANRTGVYASRTGVYSPFIESLWAVGDTPEGTRWALPRLAELYITGNQNPFYLLIDVVNALYARQAALPDQQGLRPRQLALLSVPYIGDPLLRTGLRDVVGRLETGESHSQSMWLADDDEWPFCPCMTTFHLFFHCNLR
ncbi:hypothetical protein FRB90_001006 [Tulasnella sp. 427]|nr:hypothetical protein FRB90_001006 [Tulasnella sp. 427]